MSTEKKQTCKQCRYFRSISTRDDRGRCEIFSDKEKFPKLPLWLKSIGILNLIPFGANYNSCQTFEKK